MVYVEVNKNGVQRFRQRCSGFDKGDSLLLASALSEKADNGVPVTRGYGSSTKQTNAVRIFWYMWGLTDTIRFETAVIPLQL